MSMVWIIIVCEFHFESYLEFQGIIWSCCVTKNVFDGRDVYSLSMAVKPLMLSMTAHTTRHWIREGKIEN